MGTASSAVEEEKDVTLKEKPNNSERTKDEIANENVSDKKSGTDIKLIDKRKKKRPKKKSHVLTADETVTVMHFFKMALKSETVLKETLEKIPRLFSKISLEKDHILFAKGSVIDGLYFIQSGKIRLMSSSDPGVCVSEIIPGQFYGDVEVLYNKPATSTAVTESSTTVLFLPARRLKSLMSTFNTNLEDWCLKAKHLPVYSDVQYTTWRNKFIVSTLSQVPLFTGWSELSLLSLAGLLPSYPVTLYPAHSLVMREGDPADRMLVLVKGRLSLFSGEALITSVTAFTIPFPLGEEGLCTQKEMCITALATEPCLVMRVEKGWVLQETKKEKRSCKLWEEALLRWKSLNLIRNENLATKYSALIQAEIVYKWLRDSGNFNLCPPTCIYYIAQKAEPKEYVEGMFTDDSLALLIVFHQPKGSMRNFGKVIKTIFVSPKWQVVPPRGEGENILVLWFDVPTVTRIVQGFPGAKLTLQ